MGIQSCFVNKMLYSWDSADKARFANKVFPNDVRQDMDIPYLKDTIHGHLLDIYYPTLSANQFPVLIDIHGGDFMSGDKELNRLFGLHMAKKGFLVFNLNYQLAIANVKVTDQIQDIATATAWVRAHLEQYNGNPNEVFICGHSAGAVLAVIETMTAQSFRLRKVFDIGSNNFQPYKGFVVDCGLMTFYQQSVGYWGMRNMVFRKGYKRDGKYRNMIWREMSV